MEANEGAAAFLELSVANLDAALRQVVTTSQISAASVHPSATRRGFRRFTEIDPVEQRVEQALVELDVPRVQRASLGKAENSAVQTPIK